MATPAGNRVRLIALIVPKPEPVDMAKRPENRNVTTVNVPDEICKRSESHTSPSTRCPSRKMLPYTPTNNHNGVAVTAVRLPKKSKIAFQ